MSGLLTISNSGVPARLRSMRLLVVHALAGVFLQVDADDAHPLGLEAALGIGDFQPALARKGEVVLADLKALGQVRVVVVLAVPLGEGGDLAVEGHGRPQRQLEGPAVHHRQHAGHADADRAGLRIGRGAEPRAAPAEQLAGREELDVDLQADDQVVGSVDRRSMIDDRRAGGSHGNVAARR
jgi:hypothetical protein